MRAGILAAALLVVSGTAAAGDDVFDEARHYDSSDYAAQAFYRMDFGGVSGIAPRHVLGFRMDNERALHRGAPSLLKTEFDSAGASKILMNGVDLKGIALAASQSEGGLFAGMTIGEIATLSAVVVVLGIGTYNTVDEEDPEQPSGTGGG
jgi:hypothetical protein